MTRAQRLAFLGLAAVTALVALALLSRGDDEPDRSRPGAVASTPTPDSGAETATPAGRLKATATPKPRPSVPVLSAAKVRRLKFKEGDTIRFAVKSDVDEEVHVHGYDRSKPVRAGQKVVLAFPADITGIFEIELEQSGAPVGELEVRP